MTTAAIRHTVLIVEDEQDLREMMSEALQMRGYSVVTAEEGEDALRKLEGIGRPCLILMDLLMPGMNGWDLFAKLRERPELSAVPVIVHSSAADRAPSGVTRVLRKPLSFDGLISIVREYCAAN